MKRLHLFISGNVQGIGFRATTKSRAKQLGLVGWVKNLPDRQVEVVAEGDGDKLKEMLIWCRKGPTWARVKDVEYEWEEASYEYSSFAVLND